LSHSGLTIGPTSSPATSRSHFSRAERRSFIELL
jgi:hypothetical protein